MPEQRQPNITPAQADLLTALFAGLAERDYVTLSRILGDPLPSARPRGSTYRTDLGVVHHLDDTLDITLTSPVPLLAFESLWGVSSPLPLGRPGTSLGFTWVPLGGRSLQVNAYVDPHLVKNPGSFRSPTYRGLVTNLFVERHSNAIRSLSPRRPRFNA